MTELQTSLTRFSHQQEESLRQYAADQMQKEHAADKENIRLAAKIAESAEQLSSKALQRELKVREELQTRYAQLEQVRVGVISVLLSCKQDTLSWSRYVLGLSRCYHAHRFHHD